VLPTLVGGGIALIVAIAFLGIILSKVASIPLWIVVLIGVALMVVSVVEAIRSGEDQFGGS
jgi:predicted Kef-type K+ transport protein